MFSFLFFFSNTDSTNYAYLSVICAETVAIRLAKSKPCDYREAMLGHVKKKKKKAYDSHAPYTEDR